MTSSSTHTEGDGSNVDSTTSRSRTDRYFEWLCARIWTPEGKSYWTLFELMHMKEFVWVIGNDDNRQQDGRDLKLLFTKEMDGKGRKIKEARKSYNDAVSVLEVLIGLSERVGFLIDVDPPICAWMLIKNLKLDKYHDQEFDNNYRGYNRVERVNDILDRLIWRNYQHNGTGGFFPLKHPSKNQRSVEIWYQMTEWIEENYSLHDR